MYVPNFIQAPFIMSISTYYNITNASSSCTGIAILTKFVLTAAFCVYDFANEESVRVNPYIRLCWLNDTGKVCSGQVRTVLHPNFTPINNIDDLAIIELKINATHYVHNLGGPLNLKDNCTFYGYGDTEISLFSAQVSYINFYYEPCSPLKRDTFYCATLNGRNQPCQGDYGAPLICEDYLKGIIVEVFSVGGGLGCGDRVPPIGVIVRKLSYYKDWIKNVTGLTVEDSAERISSITFIILTLLNIKLF